MHDKYYVSTISDGSTLWAYYQAGWTLEEAQQHWEDIAAHAVACGEPFDICSASRVYPCGHTEKPLRTFIPICSLRKDGD